MLSQTNPSVEADIIMAESTWVDYMASGRLDVMSFLP